MAFSKLDRESSLMRGDTGSVCCAGHQAELRRKVAVQRRHNPAAAPSYITENYSIAAANFLSHICEATDKRLLESPGMGRYHIEQGGL